MSNSNKNPDDGEVLDLLFDPATPSENPEHGSENSESENSEYGFEPSSQQLGVVQCFMCQREVAVLLAKTRRPFIRCGYCSVVVFFNGREGMRRLQALMTPVNSEGN